MSDEECMSVDDVADYVQAGRPLQKVDAEAVAKIAERARQASEQSENAGEKTKKGEGTGNIKKKTKSTGGFDMEAAMRARYGENWRDNE